MQAPKAAQSVLNNQSLTLQVSQLQPLGKKHRGVYSDGSDSMEAVFASSVCHLIESGQLKNDCIVKLVSFTCNLINESHKLISTECEVEAAPESSTAQQAEIKEEPESQGAGSPSKENMPSNMKEEERASNSPMGNKKPKVEEKERASNSPMGNKKLKVEGSGSNTPHAAKRDSDSMKTPAHPRIASLASSSRTPQPSPSEQ